MKQNINSKKNIFMLLIIIASFFMSVGYASINSVLLDVSSEVSVLSKKELHISNVQIVNENNALGNVNFYDGRYFNSTTNLAKGDITSSVTYAITVTNNTPYNYGYVGPKYMIGEQTYDNENITFEITGINTETVLSSSESITFNITFKYIGSDNTVDNVLNSGISFLFKNLSAMQLSTLIKVNEIDLLGTGLSQYEDKYYFVGSEVNNYIWFNCQDGHTSGADYCERWRIISIEEDESVRIVKDDIVEYDKIVELENLTSFWKTNTGEWMTNNKILAAGKIIYDPKQRRPVNSTLEDSYCLTTYNGCNAYASDQNVVGSYYDLNVDADSLMKLYLENVYYQYGLTRQAKGQVQEHTYPIGSVGVSLTLDDVILSENSITINSNIGLLHPSDFVIISNNDNCKFEFTKYYRSDCMLTNWLAVPGKQHQMMNGKFLGLDYSRAQIWTIKDEGYIYSQDASNEFYLRPVVVLDKNQQAVGIGTSNEDDYYMLVT